MLTQYALPLQRDIAQQMIAALAAKGVTDCPMSDLPVLLNLLSCTHHHPCSHTQAVEGVVQLTHEAAGPEEQGAETTITVHPQARLRFGATMLSVYECLPHPMLTQPHATSATTTTTGAAAATADRAVRQPGREPVYTTT